MKFLAALLLPAVILAGPAMGQQYPQKPVRVVVTNPAGQGTDIIARQYMVALSARLGQSFFVDNKPGAGGTVGTREVARAAPDGYTLLVGTAATHGISLALYENPGYDPEKDFIPIGMLGRTSMAIAARVGSGIQSLGDLIAQSKKGKVDIALPSPMATLVRDLLVKREGGQLADIPYKGSPMAINDVLGGHVNVLVDTSSAIQPHVASGKFVPLAITTLDRSRIMPGVKTVAEQGLPGFEISGWFLLFAPKGTPSTIIDTLNTEMQKIHADPEFQNQLIGRGFDIAPVGEVAKLPEFIRVEHERWVRMAKDSNMKAP